MASVSLLLLPEEIWGSHLMQFLDVSDIVHLDTSVMQRSLRERLLTIFRLTIMPEFQLKSDNHASWLISKKFRSDILFVYREVSAAAILKLAIALPNLHGLDLLWFAYEDEFVVEITSHCRDITHLNLGSCWLMTKQSVLAVARNCPNLRKFCASTLKTESLEACDAALHALISSCSQLEEITIDSTQMTFVGFAHILEHGRNLKSLEIIGAHDLQCRECLLDMHHLPLLESITLSDCSMSNALMATIGRTCTNLRTLHLDSIRFVDDAGLMVVAYSCPLLTQLFMSTMDITDVSVKAFCLNCPLLVHVELAYCALIEESVLEVISNSLPKLVKLRLYQAGEITHRGIVHLARNCPQLQNLILYVEAGIVSTETLRLLLGQCKLLTTLDMRSGWNERTTLADAQRIVNE